VSVKTTQSSAFRAAAGGYHDGVTGELMKIDPKEYRVRAGSNVDLGRWPTSTDPLYADQQHYKETLERQVRELSRQQQLLCASESHAVLLLIQAMDAGGKDSLIEHVMSGVNPQGCQVTSFKPPCEQELKHDFLWRSACALPGRGLIGIFNRSYYEDVLIVRVHPERLQDEGVPAPRLHDKTIWHERYRSIVDFERHLDRNATRIIKIFLHISKDEQRKRFIERIDDPEKNWKIRKGDIEERNFWNDYVKAYEKCLAATSTRHAPWHVVPADDKPNARLIVSGILLDALEALNLRFPEPTPRRRRELLAIRKKLEK
jgi:PPK2 family polyphosphate:nucleotide phosphotransferase